ncbi:Protein of unknown function [Amycolatopsis marina]|uniref:Inner membrane protein YgaP-like transmembrane domain-containing protein n=1 Tax=Amycolatopsis marina TaxID=490629 RepID=A0A1I1CNT2_9PSEU|nr:DUF2892 domain-containing protein [Amycolatopsis marina]SFB62558.1 Protein of unknown function [Amycolatopsis marina]
MADRLKAHPGQGNHARWSRPAVNMTGVERWVRLLAGILLAVGGSWVIASQLDGGLAAGAWALLALGVVDLVLSGLTGFCPVYRFVRAPGTRRRPS